MSTTKNKLDKKKLLDSLKLDLQGAEQLRKEQDSKILQWRNEYDGKPYGNEQEGKSSIVSRDIKKQSEWQHATLVDPFVSSNNIIKTYPVTYEDKPAARQNELLLNTQFCRQFDRFNFMTKSIKLLDMEGTAIIQTGWEYEDYEVQTELAVFEVDELGNEYIAGYREATEIVVTKNQPTARVCRNEDVYIDPTCMDDLDKCQFVIYRYETDISTLKQEAKSKNYKNLDKIKPETGHADYDYDYDSEDDTNFRFEDDPRKKLVVYEYWGNYDVDGDGIAEPIVCSWIHNTVIRLQENPYPDKKPPFIIVPFNSIPFKMYGEANAELISDNQKIKTALYRGSMDNMAQSTNGMKGIKKGALDTMNKERFLAGQNFEYNGNLGNDIFEGRYNELPSSVDRILARMDNDIESITGVKAYSQGISGASLGSTATGARGALDATSTRRLNIVRNIGENLVKPLMRKWMAYNSEFLSEEEIVRVTNEEFVPVRRDDLMGKVDIDIEVSTAEDNAAKAQELGFLLQTMGPNEDPKLRQLLRADIYELMGMPDKAQMLREYQPQPDPLAQQEALLRIQLLEAQVFNERAKGQENAVDVQLKQAKTANEIAKARNINSKSDIEDLRFLKEDGQIDDHMQMEKEAQRHAYIMEQKEFDRKANLDQEAFKSLTNNKGN